MFFFAAIAAAAWWGAAPAGASDEPDQCRLDSDCDGLDGERNNAIFVSVLGTPNGRGTETDPISSIRFAMTTATNQGKRAIFLGNGTFFESSTLELVDGVSLFGGFVHSAQFGWSRPAAVAGSSPAWSTVVRVASSTAVRADGIDVRTVVDSLDVLASDVPSGQRGVSSYGLFARNSDALVLRNARFTAGKAAPGAEVADRTDALQLSGAMAPERPLLGQPGCTNGGAVCSKCTQPAGGAGGTSKCGGGAGGAGGNAGLGENAGLPGKAGTGVGGGQGGVGAACCFCKDMMDCLLVAISLTCAKSFSHGGDGSTGAQGGAGSLGSFSLRPEGYVPVSGGTGLTGGGGAGGGGGGGGGGGVDKLCESYGASGAGGGSGGCGGGGGQGGGSGGASIGIYLSKSSAVLFAVHAAAGEGGAGARGGLGQFGSAGQRGANIPLTSTNADKCKGGEYGDDFNGDQDDGTNSGAGGNGGNGGRGGAGGNGAAGSSIALVYVDGSAPLLVDVTTSHAPSVGTGGVAANFHDGVSAKSSLAQMVRVAARLADGAALGLTVGESARLLYDVSALQVPSDASITFSLRAAFNSSVLVGNASANGRAGDCAVGAPATSGSCGLECNVGGLRGGAVSRVVFDVALPQSAVIDTVRSPLCACYELAGGVRETGYCFRVGDVLAPVVRAVDLSVSGAFASTTATAGVTARLQVTVRNEQPTIDAPSPIVEITVEDVALEEDGLPAGCELVPPAANASARLLDDLRLRCTLTSLVTLVPTATVSVPLVISASALALVASARVVPRAPDPQTGNNAWSETLPLSRRFDLNVLVVDTVLPLGQKARVAARIGNKGPSTARNVTATVTLAAAATFARADIAVANLTGVTCTTTDRVVTCTLPSVPPGEYELDIPTTLTAEPSSGSLGVTAALTVADDGGGAGFGEARTNDNTATLQLALRYGVPSVRLAVPAVLPLAGETTLRLMGDGFTQSPMLKCRVGPAAPRAATFVSNVEVTCVAPASPSTEAGVFAVAVSNDGVEYGNVTANVTYFAPPTLQLVSPSPINQRVSLDFVINGVGFPDTPGIVVRFDKAIVGKCERRDSSHLNCKLNGAQPMGSKVVALTIEGVDFDQSTLTVEVVDAPTPAPNATPSGSGNNNNNIGEPAGGDGGGLSAGVIVAIVLGALAVVVLLLVLIWWCVTRRRRRAPADDGGPHTGTSLDYMYSPAFNPDAAETASLSGGGTGALTKLAGGSSSAAMKTAADSSSEEEENLKR